MKEDSGRGYRRVVPSPLPVDVIEKAMISSLLSSGHVVICAGGGGIPVIERENKLEGVAAVIDKDFASAKIAELIDADTLVILTAVEHVYVHFNTPNQKPLTDVKRLDLEPYLDAEEFAKGSMQPKVKACLDFLNNSDKSHVRAVISSLDHAVEAFQFKTGTIISK